MARRSTRTKKPAEEEVVEQDIEQEQEEVEEEQEVAREAEEESENEMAEQEEGTDDPEVEQRSLEFDEELSWRPAKPIPSATLLARLERLSRELADLEQGATDLDSLKDVASKLGHRNLLQHKDRGVKAYTACCLVDILRLFVPDAPLTDDQLKVCGAEPMTFFV